MARQNDLLGNFSRGGVLLDGGMGSMLIDAGLKIGAPPEEWNRSRPQVIRGIHTAYLEAGAQVIETNTFGCVPSRMTGFGLGESLAELNNAAVRLAREAVDSLAEAGGERFVALSIGPTGKMLPPVGGATEAEIRADYEGQIGCLTEPVDLILIETIFDLKEGLIALEAARKLSEVPVAVTMTFNKNPRGFFTIMGNAAADSMRELERAGADIIGANCTLASREMVELAAVLRESTSLPLLCQPNAGSPTVRNGRPVYEQTAAEFAADAVRLYETGVNAVGGCCGTTPEFIREVRARRKA
jgi:5-methyltetrahydrofolate--homocysteine methyltransferase